MQKSNAKTAMTKKKHSLLAIVSCLLLLAMAIGFTSLYLTDNDTATNTVTVGDVKIDLLEPNWEDTNDVVPNQELTKDPQIKNVGINDAVVFMTVEVPIENITIVADDGTKGTKGNSELFWFKDSADGVSTHANNFDSNWVHLDTRDTGANLAGATRTYVFAYKTPISNNETTTALFDKIQVKNFIENEIPAGKTEQIKINAYGIQASDVLESGVDLTDTLSNANLDKIYGIFIKQAFNQTEPEHQDLTYNVENVDVQSYMATPAYDASDYSYTNMTEKTIIYADRPASGILTVPNGASTITVTSAVDGKSFTDTMSGTSYAVQNLIPGISYTYEMKDSSNNVVKDGTITPTGQVRMINGGGNTFNIRDIGGWAADGGTLKYGTIYRGGELNSHVSLNNNQKQFFIDFLNVKNELDLRTNDEARDIVESPLGNSVNYVRYPTDMYKAGIVQSTKYGVTTNAVQVECAFANAFKDVAQNVSQGNPFYIHCSYGADRTGTLLATIEGVCGVSLSDIEKDFELSSFSSNDNNTEKYRTNDEWSTMITNINKMNGTSFRDKVISYLLKIGVTIEEVNQLRSALIDGTPATLPNPIVVSGNLFDSSAATLSSRIRSDGSTTSYSSNMLVTDFIPVNKNTEIHMETDKAQNFDSYAGYFAFYDSNKNYIVGDQWNNRPIWVKSSDEKSGELPVYVAKTYNGKNVFPDNVAYVRLCVAYEDINNINIWTKTM